MTFIGYTVVAGETVQNLTAFYNGQTYLTDGTNPNFARIVAGLSAVPQDESVMELFSVEKAVAAKFDRLSERVSIANGTVYFNGDPVHSLLTDHIVSYLNEGAEFGPLVNLLENVYQNMEPHVRDNLYRWMESTHGLTTDEYGYIIAYKGVRSNPDDPNIFTSINTTGSAIVDGERYTGAIPNKRGVIVEMPRSDVQFDPAVGCSTGLHVGTWEYASSFAQGAVLTVRVNPRDVVSVPVECESQKMRVCRYEVIDVTEVKIEHAYFEAFSNDDLLDEEDAAYWAAVEGDEDADPDYDDAPNYPYPF